MKCEVNKQFNRKAILYFILLSSTLVLSNFLAEYSFSLFGYGILFSVFSYPLTFLLANIITKKYGSYNTLLGILIAVIVQLLVFCVLVCGEIELDILLVIGTLTSFALAQLLNLYLCSKIINKRTTYLKLSLLYSTVIIFDGIAFLTIINKGLIHNLGAIILISLFIKIIIGLLLAIIDKNIKQ